MEKNLFLVPLTGPSIPDLAPESSGFMVAAVT
jgi:hypothetical protein